MVLWVLDVTSRNILVYLDDQSYK